MKLVNRRTANQFHDWQRVNLPGKFVIQDIDTWVLVISDSTDDYRPLALIEEKRSSIPPETWTPFKDDLPNYMALYQLSLKAELPLWILYFTPEFPESKIALFKIKSVNPASVRWIDYDKHVLTSSEFQRDFKKFFE